MFRDAITAGDALLSIAIAVSLPHLYRRETPSDAVACILRNLASAGSWVSVSPATHWLGTTAEEFTETCVRALSLVSIESLHASVATLHTHPSLSMQCMATLLKAFGFSLVPTAIQQASIIYEPQRDVLRLLHRTLHCHLVNDGRIPAQLHRDIESRGLPTSPSILETLLHN